MLNILGGTVPLAIDVLDAAGALVNASTNVLTITLPDGATAAPATSNPSTGVYTCLYIPSQAGRHEWKWITTGPATAKTGVFDVSSTTPGLIIGLDEAKAFLNIRATDTDQDDELSAMLEGVAAVVEHEVGAVVRRTRTSILRPCGYYRQIPIPYSPVVSVTSATLVRDSSSVDVTGWYADGSVLYAGLYGTLPVEPFTLTYVVGRPDLPTNIRMGALEILKLAWASQRASDPPTFLVSNKAREWLAPDMQVLGFA